jgi:hypothetical protein
VTRRKDASDAGPVMIRLADLQDGAGAEDWRPKKVFC